MTNFNSCGVGFRIIKSADVDDDEEQVSCCFARKSLDRFELDTFIPIFPRDRDILPKLLKLRFGKNHNVRCYIYLVLHQISNLKLVLDFRVF